MPSLVKDLITAGIHFGHRSTNWNPKMAPYIHGKKNKIHIIDPKATIKGLLLARKFISKAVAEGKDILFVGTKRQARTCIEQCVKPTGMPYVTERWLGGTLTNFRTIRERLKRLEELEGLVSTGAIQTYSKKMESQLTRERLKILRNLDGIRNMTKLPGAMVVVDVKREINAVKEARKLGIPTICLIDTDSDPDYADIPIPGNDDAMRAIELVISSLCAAVQEGKQGRAADKEAVEAAGGPGDEEAGSGGPGGHRPRRSSRAQFRAVDAPAASAAAAPEAGSASAPAAPAEPAPPAAGAQA
jgi:small subunit ribosomal protein S2